jgi:hypothetical protein
VDELAHEMSVLDEPVMDELDGASDAIHIVGNTTVDVFQSIVISHVRRYLFSGFCRLRGFKLQLCINPCSQISLL